MDFAGQFCAYRLKPFRDHSTQMQCLRVVFDNWLKTHGTQRKRVTDFVPFKGLS